MIIPVRVGFSTQNQHCGTIENVPCPNCGKIVPFWKIKNTTTGTVLFIPVAKTTNSAFVMCSDCRAAYEVNKKEFSRISSSQEAIQAIYSFHANKMEREQQIREKYSVGFSTKNQTAAVILSALLTTYGVPFFYIGKPLIGVLCLLVSIASCVLQFFPVMFAVVIGGFVYAVLLGQGKMKDGKGKYIASQKQQLLFTQGVTADTNGGSYE